MDMAPLDAILAERKYGQEHLIEVLQEIQGAFNHLPEEALRRVAATLQVPIIEVFRVANFYKAFTLKPRGRHLITVCLGTACHVRGAPRFVDLVSGLLQIGPGETSEDMAFTLETVNCVGACALGPVLIMDGIYHDHMTAKKLRLLVRGTQRKDKERKSNGENKAS